MPPISTSLPHHSTCKCEVCTPFEEPKGTNGSVYPLPPRKSERLESELPDCLSHDPSPDSPGKVTDVDLIMDALAERITVDAEQIAVMGLSIIATLIRKNLDYGSCIFEQGTLSPDVPIDSAIRVRMGDKIGRINTLLSQKRDPHVEESLEDSFRDLAGYAILYLCQRERVSVSGSNF